MASQQDNAIEISDSAKQAIEFAMVCFMADVAAEMKATIAVMHDEIRKVVQIQGPVQEMKVHQSTAAE